MSHRSLINSRAVSLGLDGEGEKISFTVRGLSLADITTIMREGGAPFLREAYQLVTQPGLTNRKVEDIILEFLEVLPDLVAKVIARAADLDDWTIARDLSLGNTLDLIDVIVELTFTSERVVKKAMEIVRRYAMEPTGLPSASKTGSGA